MIINLTSLKEKETAFDFLLAPEEINLGDEAVKLKDGVEIRGNLTKGIAQIDIKGEISARAELECTRCLQPVENFLEIPFEAVFIAPEHFSEDRETQVNSGDLEVSVLESDKIDLSEVAREQILLNIPAQIFCRANCKGLCQKCGANRNLLDCNCEEKEIDPRWAKLKELK